MHTTNSTTGLAWWQGSVRPADQAVLPLLTHALHYASCCIEGIRADPVDSGWGVLQLDGHLRRLHRNATILGLSAMRLGDTNRMIEAGQSLTQSRPGSADGWVLLGVAALERGDKAEATRLLSEAAAREPSRELPRRLMAQANPATPVAVQTSKTN